MAIEVTRISRVGVGLLYDGRELFMPYEDFPWFKEVPVVAIIDVEEISPGNFRWPRLDVDLGVETIEHPERYPLKAR